MIYFIFFIGLVFSAYFIVLRGPDVKTGDIVRKSIASSLFVFAGLIAAAFSQENTFVCILIIMGLFCGVLGDIYLDFKCAYPNNEKILLYSGFISFLIGHIFYSAAMIIEADLFKPLPFIILIATFIIFAIGIYLLEKPLKMDFKQYKLITVLYTAFISLPLMSSILVMIYNPNKHHLIRMIAMILFVLSDIVLSGTYFGKNKNTKKDIVINHFLYYAAQYLIAFSLLP